MTSAGWVTPAGVFSNQMTTQLTVSAGFRPSPLVGDTALAHSDPSSERYTSDEASALAHCELVDLMDRVAATNPPPKVTVTRFVARNWLTPCGREIVTAAIKEKMPDLRDARFFTLTIDPRMAGALIDEESGEAVVTDDVCRKAYELGKAQLRDFFRRIRYGVSYRYDDVEEGMVVCHPFEHGSETFDGTGERTRYAWKLEFQQNGMPHWHVCFLYRRKIPLDAVTASWALGMTETARIRGNGLEYLFKYLSKSPFTEETGGLPEWVLDYPRQIRFWQSSKGFYSTSPGGHGPNGTSSPACESAEEPASGPGRVFRTIREKLAMYPTLFRAWTSEFPEVRRFAAGLRFETALVLASWAALIGLGDAPDNTHRAEVFETHLEYLTAV